MARRGPPPIPEALRKLSGKRHRKKEDKSTLPTVTVGVPKVPSHLGHDPIALAMWVQLCKHLKKMRVLGPQDGIVLEGMCMAYSRALKADALVRKEGMFITQRRRGRVVHPAVKISEKAWRDVRVFSQEFGLTPSSATRVRAVSASSAQEEAAEEAEAFLFHGGKIGKVIGHVGRGGRRKDKKDKD
jgi:P27 family predicted phage terminase small subunit